jgi:cation transport regulator ChaC
METQKYPGMTADEIYKAAHHENGMTPPEEEFLEYLVPKLDKTAKAERLRRIAERLVSAASAMDERD